MQWSVAIATWIPCQTQRQPDTPGTPRMVPRTATEKQGLLTAPKGGWDAGHTSPSPAPPATLPPPQPLLPPSQERPQEAQLWGLALPTALLPAHQPSPHPGWRQARSMETGPESRGWGRQPTAQLQGPGVMPSADPRLPGEGVGVEEGHGGSGSWGPHSLGHGPLGRGASHFLGTSPHQARDLQPAATMSFNLGEGVFAVHVTDSRLRLRQVRNLPRKNLPRKPR